MQQVLLQLQPKRCSNRQRLQLPLLQQHALPLSSTPGLGTQVLCALVLLCPCLGLGWLGNKQVRLTRQLCVQQQRRWRKEAEGVLQKEEEVQ